MSYTWLPMLLMETWRRFWLVTCYGESSGRLTGGVYDSDPNVMNLWDDGCLWHGLDGWMDRFSVRTVRCRLNVTLYLPVWCSFYLFTIFFTSFLIKRLEIDYTPSCTHFYPYRMDWTDGTVPYDGFSFSYDGVSFSVFFFYFSCITRIYAIFIANWILYVDYYILHTRCYRCRIAILPGLTAWLYSYGYMWIYYVLGIATVLWWMKHPS